jgi:hypothetical protein
MTARVRSRIGGQYGCLSCFHSNRRDPVILVQTGIQFFNRGFLPARDRRSEGGNLDAGDVRWLRKSTEQLTATLPQPLSDWNEPSDEHSR